MTCIAGIVKDGTVWIGGDSAGVGGWYSSVRADRKVFRNGPMIIGFTTSFRMGQLLEYRLKVPPRADNQDVFAYMVTDFIDAVRDCLKVGGFAAKNSETEKGGDFLVGYEGRLFRICDDYQVGENADGIDSVGCGSDLALGAMYALRDHDARHTIATGLSAAAHFNIGVRGPFYIKKGRS